MKPVQIESCPWCGGAGAAKDNLEMEQCYIVRIYGNG